MVSTASPHNDIYTETLETTGITADASSATLIAPDGQQVAIAPDTYALFARILHQLSLGRGIQLVVYDQDLTTQQAADILNISRQYLVRLLDSKVIPSHKVGTHRRVRLQDVLEYRTARSESRRESLARLTRASQEMGDY